MVSKSIKLLIFCCILMLTACSNPYKNGVDYDDFPDMEIPIYDDALVYSYEGEDDEWELNYGISDDIDDLIEFYEDEFDDEDYFIENMSSDKDEFICSGYVLSDELYFEIEAEEADDDTEDFFDYVVEVKVEETDLPENITVGSSNPSQNTDDIDENQADEENTDEMDESDYSPSSIDGTVVDLGYLSVTVIDGWYTLDIADGIQIYKDDMALQIGLQGYGLDEDYARTYIESINVSSDIDPLTIENLWGIDFFTTRYWAGSYHQTVHAKVFNDEGQMLVVNVVGAPEETLPDDIQQMINSVVFK